MNCIKKILISAALTGIMCCLMCPVAYGAQMVLSDDFESYTESVSNTKGYKQIRSTTLVETEDGNYARLCPQSTSDWGRLLYDAANTPNEKQIISFDFMLESNQGGMNLELFGVQNENASGYACRIYSNGTKVCINSNSPEWADKAVISDIKLNKWYNVQVILDFENKTYDFRCGEDYYQGIPFMDDSLKDIKRIISIMQDEYRYIHPVYVDNLDVAVMNNFELDNLVYEAKSLYVNATTGYEHNMYPKSAVDGLYNSYLEVYSRFADGLPEEESSELTDKISAAIALFKERKIDTRYTGENVPNHIQEEFPEEILIPAEGTQYDLLKNSSVRSKNLTVMGETAEWETENVIDGVTITDGVLNINHSASGSLLLKGTTESGIVLRKKIKLTPLGTVTIDKFSAFNENVSISGRIDKIPEYDVTITFSGEDIPERSEKLAIDGEGTFTWECSLPANAKSQSLMLEISGKDIIAVNDSRKYYGDTWKEDAVERFNNAADEKTVQALFDEYVFDLEALTLNKELYLKNPDYYWSYILKYKPYTSVENIDEKLYCADFMLDMNYAARENIERIFEKYKSFMEKCGFVFDELNAVSAANKVNFYIDAANMSLDLQTATTDSVIDELNKIVQKYKEVKPDSVRPSGGGGGSGKAARSSDSAGNTNFEINPITDLNNQKDDKTKAEESSNFDDLEGFEWAKEAFGYLRKKGIVVGENNCVRPNDKITRGECAKILVMAFDLKNNGSGFFEDSEGMWWKEYAETAASNGIINGTGNGCFGGEEPVTREMLSAMIYRLIQKKNIELYDKKDNYGFSDESIISDYAKESVEFLFKKGIISGVTEKLFQPQTAATRAQTAKMIYGVLNEIK